MHQFCFMVNGQQHCFNVPALIDQLSIRKPPPENDPPFELAVSVLMLVDAVPKSALSEELAQASLRYISKVKAGMPKGVELVSARQLDHAAVA